jgi:maltase-glucoamylase
MAIEQDGSAHGLLIMNSNAQEYKFSALQTFNYRSIGGIIDIFMFSGPSPENVIQQYTELVGRPFFPPYYALGFQLCRYGYNSLANLKAAVDRTINAQIPLDIQYADIDYFDRQLDFTYDKVNFAGLPEYINQIKQQGIRFIPILDPAIMISGRELKLLF